MASTAAQAARETARLGVEGVAAGIIEIGAATPVVAPLCVALLKAKEVVDKASRNKEELDELQMICQIITEKVIDKAKASKTSTINVKPLQECVDQLKVVAERYHDRGRLAKLVHFRTDGDDIQRLRARIRDIVPIMTFVLGVDLWALIQARPKLAPEPPGVPKGQAWHAVRDGVEDSVYEILGADGGPVVAALIGRSGAGKTTAAAAMVGERQGSIRPRADEMEDQARTRLLRLRERFSDGVVWLRVGKGEGAADRLPRLMLGLAKCVGKVLEGVRDPEIGEAGESYVKKIMELKNKQCLVVADDVCEAEVVEKLRETGMWVLLTTRFSKIVEPCEQVFVDRLGEMEAKYVLRGAANLPPDGHLCDDARQVLEICGGVAMDIAFVGSWSSVRTPDNCAPKSSRAWTRAVEEIEAQGGGVGGDRDPNRLAILRAGFKYLAREDPLAQELYAMLAVFPDGHSFQESDAAVLLDDEEAAAGPISILERWGVVRADASEKYRMHDAHVDFARGKLRVQEDCRKPAVQRWMSHISRLDVAIGYDLYVLLNIWRALEDVGGEGWWALRPYDDQLVQMASDAQKVYAVHVVAELYEHHGKTGELEALMRKILENYGVYGGDCPEVEMIALYYTRNALGHLGRVSEREEAESRLGELRNTGLQLTRTIDGIGPVQMSTTFSTYGVCARAAGHLKDAEHWFQKALVAQVSGGLATCYQTVFATLELGKCAQEAGRLGEAEAWFKPALEIQEVELGVDDIQVANTLHAMGICVLLAGRQGEAEELCRRALKIKEAKLGADDVQVTATLELMGYCVQQAGWPGEAEELFRRALKINEAKFGADDLRVVSALYSLGHCVRKAGRPREAKELFRRAVETQQAKLGPDEPQPAWLPHLMGLCMQEAGRPGEAEELFRCAVEIEEAKFGADDPRVAKMLYSLGRCMREAGRPGEAEELYRRALKIEEVKLGPDHPGVANTLHQMGLCMRQAGRLGEAEELYRRALKIKPAKLEPDDVGVSHMLHEMGQCVRKAGRPGEAEEFFGRAVELQESKWGVDDSRVAVMLYSLGQCVREAGRPGDADALISRALEIQEAKLGPDHVDVAEIRLELSRCAEDAGDPAETE